MVKASKINVSDNTPAEDLLKEIQDQFSKNKVLEKRIRKILYGIIFTFGVLSIGAFGNTLVIQNDVKRQGEQIDVIRKNYISYDNFFIFNRAYELQIEEIQALIDDDEEALKKIQEKYNELRSMIVTNPLRRRGN